jgi:hypothetical protein
MLDKGQNWNCWIDVGNALVLLRQEAMANAGTNRPVGSAYNRFFGAKVRDERLEFDKSDRFRLFEVMDNLPAIEAWRETLPLTELRRFNHPSTVIRRWKRATEFREPGEKRETSKWERQQAENARLTEELDAARAEIAKRDAHIEELKAAREDGAGIMYVKRMNSKPKAVHLRGWTELPDQPLASGPPAAKEIAPVVAWHRT